MRPRMLAAVLLVGAGVLGACDSGGEEPAGLDATQATDTPEATEPAEETPTAAADDEAALLDLYEAYWDAVVASENGPDTSYGPFEDIATEDVIERQLSRAHQWEEMEVSREGEPRIYDTVVTVDGDTARIESCKDEQDWLLVDDGEPVEIEEQEPTAYVVTAERHGDTWLIDEWHPPSEANISCEE